MDCYVSIVIYYDINWSEITFKSLNLKEAMDTSIGMQWRHGATIFTKFKLFNVTSDQLMDCNVTIDHYRHIAVHKLDRNYIEKLKFGQNCQIHLLSPM